jgi:hypothetical protein
VLADLPLRGRTLVVGHIRGERELRDFTGHDAR